MASRTAQQMNILQQMEPLLDGKIVQGRKARAVTTAKSTDPTGRDYPATVTVTEYNCPLGVKLISGAGYRPQPNQAVKPVYVSGIYASTSNPLEFFDVGPVIGSREIAVTCEAQNTAAGDWDASVSTSYSGAAPLASDPLKFVGHTVLKEFAISKQLYFGFGTRWEPGFQFKQTTKFNQAGYFGVIQLIRGCFTYQVDGSGEWRPYRLIPEYVLDTPDTQIDPVTQRVKIAIGNQTIEFRDAPGLELGHLIKDEPTVRAVRINLRFKTYFMFNPSNAADPNQDTETTWYPLAGIEWECGAKICWTGQLPRGDREHWKFYSNYHDMLAMPANEFPEWSDRLHAAPLRDPSARGSNVVASPKL